MTPFDSCKSEEFWLDFFWRGCQEPDVSRITLLKVLAAVRIQRPPEWRYWDVRHAPKPTLSASQCAGCRASAYRFHWHHIIQVQYGGSNDPRNFVPLCGLCHHRLHPWLPAQRFVRGWESMTELTHRYFDKVLSWMRA